MKNWVRQQLTWWAIAARLAKAFATVTALYFLQAMASARLTVL